MAKKKATKVPAIARARGLATATKAGGLGSKRITRGPFRKNPKAPPGGLPDIGAAVSGAVGGFRSATGLGPGIVSQAINKNKKK